MEGTGYRRLTDSGVALFDFDGTLLKGDSIAAYICFCVRVGFAPPVTLLRALRAYGRYAFGRATALHAKEASLAFLKGHSVRDARDAAERFYDRVIKKRLFHGTLQEMNRCLAEGMTVLIVTASPDVYMEVIAQALGAAGVIATRCAVDAQGFYTGKLASANCSGREKTRRVEAYFLEHHIRFDVTLSRGYGNSLGDLPMLHMTRHPVWVNAKAATARKAPDFKRVTWK